MIPRLLENIIRNDFHLQKAVVILGARQVGKTTLIRQLIQNELKYLLINGDEPDARDQISNLSSDRLRALIGDAEYIIVDEAQLIPEIGITLKRITDYVKGIRVIVSGSSSLELSSSINEPLTGRKLEYQLFPISFGEMCVHTSLTSEKRMVPHRMVFGYYPEIVTSRNHSLRLIH